MNIFKFNVKSYAVVPFLAIAVIFLILHYTTWSQSSELKSEIYNDPENSINDRVNDLLSQMTLVEKIGQMALVEKNSIKKIEDISKYGIGAVLSGFGAKPDDNSSEGWQKMVDKFINESKKSRLGIPILYGVDAIHGHSNVPGNVVFPHAIGLGASGDIELVKKIASATKEQLLATNVNWNYSPTYDIPQDVRWGRVYEAFSDDPKLVSALGEAYIEGLQENINNPSKIDILATPKHT